MPLYIFELPSLSSVLVNNLISAFGFSFSLPQQKIYSKIIYSKHWVDSGKYAGTKSVSLALTDPVPGLCFTEHSFCPQHGGRYLGNTKVKEEGRALPSRNSCFKRNLSCKWVTLWEGPMEEVLECILKGTERETYPCWEGQMIQCYLNITLIFIIRH